MADTCNLTTRCEIPYPDIGADDWGADYNAKIQLSDALIASLQDDNDFVGNVSVTGAMSVTEYLYHYQDTGANTYLRFREDRVGIVAGAVNFIDIVEDTQDKIDFNPDGGDVDYNFYTASSLRALGINGADGAITCGGTLQALRAGFGVVPDGAIPLLVDKAFGSVNTILGDTDGSSSVYFNGNCINAAYTSDTDSASLWLNYEGHLKGVTRFRDLTVGDGKHNPLLRVDGSTGLVSCLAGLAVDGGALIDGGLCVEDGQINLGATVTTAATWRTRTATTTCYLEYSANGTDWVAYGTFTAA